MPAHIIKKLQEEIQALEFELNNELPKELKRARAMGDLAHDDGNRNAHPANAGPPAAHR